MSQPNQPQYGGPQNPNQQWQQWQQQQPPKKKRGGCLKWFAIIAGLFIVLIVIIAAVSMSGGGSNDNASSGGAGNSESNDSGENQDGSTVTFEAETADGSNVSVTYTNASDGVSQAQDNSTTSPWSKEIHVGKHDSLNVNMLAQQEGSGDVTCRILLDGQEVNSNTSSGPYSIATCNFSDFLR